MAQVDMFLKIDGIEGESADAKHKGEIDVQSYSMGGTQSGTFSIAGGGGAGKVAMQDMHFVANVSKASPKLHLAMANGDHIKSAVLTIRKAGKEQQEFKKITLSDVLISSYQSGSSQTYPTDQFSLNFAKIEYEYKEQKSDGTLGGAVKTGYDLKKNQKV